MNKLALFVPLLALAAAPARAEDPATNAPVLPAWFGDIRIGMSTNEFFARLPDAKWTCEDEGPTPWLVELEHSRFPADASNESSPFRGRTARYPPGNAALSSPNWPAVSGGPSEPGALKSKTSEARSGSVGRTRRRSPRCVP